MIQINNSLMCDFGTATRLLREGKKLRRKGWENKDVYIILRGEEIVLTGDSNEANIHWWSPTMLDMFSEDWICLN